MDVSLNQLIQFYLTNTLNLRPLTPQVIPCYTHKKAIVSRACIRKQFYQTALGNLWFDITKMLIAVSKQ